MFKKKISYPSLSTGKKIFVILQLCFAFSLLLWCLFQPYMGDFFRIRSHQLLYDYVLGQGNSIKDSDKLIRNAERFKELPEAKQADILKQYSRIQSALNIPFSTKFLSSLQFYAKNIPSFEFAWIFFSILISIYLLKGRPGATQAVWLLPIITLFYGLDNHFYGSNPILEPDRILFPEERIIANDAIGDWKNQEDQLRQGWKRYLIKEWSTLAPADKMDEASLLEEAEFNFTLARIEIYQSSGMKPWVAPSNEKEGLATLGLFLLWNLFFALKLSKAD